jgi:hypothetical protein
MIQFFYFEKFLMGTVDDYLSYYFDLITINHKDGDMFIYINSFLMFITSALYVKTLFFGLYEDHFDDSDDSDSDDGSQQKNKTVALYRRLFGLVGLLGKWELIISKDHINFIL